MFLWGHLFIYIYIIYVNSSQIRVVKQYEHNLVKQYEHKLDDLELYIILNWLHASDEVVAR